MRIATWADEEKVVNILAASYDSNPSINWIIDCNASDRSKRIKELASYSFKVGMYRQGVFISSDGNGAAICFKYSNKKFSLKLLFLQIKLAWAALGIHGIKEALRRESYVENRLPTSTDFLYFWFFGVIPGKHSGNSAKELKDHIFQWSLDSNLPIYVETTVKKNKRVYERYGFQLYHTWKVPNKDFNLYFMKREAAN
jgi:hypothetical protein